MIIELLGYLASALIVLSLAMASVVRLRTISFLGSVAFVVYGVAIGAWPVVLTNVIAAGLNLWHLRRELGPRTDLATVRVDRDDPYLVDFLRTHLDDVHRSQPGFTGADDGDVALVVTRSGLPAGVLVGARDGHTLHVHLDYVLPAHRDSRLGRWLYGPGAEVLRDLGVRRVVAHADTDVHRRYLQAVGFVPDGDRWERTV